MKQRIPISLRWSDIDGYGHVSNSDMLRLLEEARIAAFWSGKKQSLPTAVLEGGPGSDTFTLVARHDVEYVNPIPYLRAPLELMLWIGRMGQSSLQVCYEVWSPQGEEPRQLFVRARSAVVLADAATGMPRPISPEEREAWEPYLESPIKFARE